MRAAVAAHARGWLGVALLLACNSGEAPAPELDRLRLPTGALLTPEGRWLMVTNSKGQRIINVTALEAHAITPRPIVLRGATLVRQTP